MLAARSGFDGIGLLTAQRGNAGRRKRTPIKCWKRVFPPDYPSLWTGGHSMSKRFSLVARRSGTALLCLSASIGLPRAAAAQFDGGGEPAVAMGVGRGVQGIVTAVTPDHLTLKTERGEVYQVAISANTRVLKGREPIRLAEVHTGDGIGAIGELDAPNKTVHALYLMVVDAEQIKKAREALGKTWISGTVTAIDETRITVLRPDQVSQVIAVDEDTSFRRGGRSMQMAMGGGGAQGGGRAGATPQDAGESVTLLDVKVGSLVAGPGTLKKGVFVPTTLGIGEASARGRRRQGGGAGSTPAPGTTGEPKIP